MSVLIPATEIAAGDYSEEHGTVQKVTTSATADYVEILFVNGKSISASKSTELLIDQGGRFDRPVAPVVPK